jgi:hypothetical protein
MMQEMRIGVWGACVVLALGVTSARALDEGLDDGFASSVPQDWCERPAGQVVPAVESFETDSALGAMGASVRRPRGALSDVIVYCSAGHGFTANTSSGEWVTQRPLLYGMVEDMGNIDQLNMFAEYCFNAGATVVPMRPVGHQTNEVVLDNVDAEVSFSGTWYDSVSTNFYGNVGETPYRYAYISTNGESCFARYRPNIPEAGYYPVYTWVRYGSDRVKQVYRICHAGGVTELDVNHRRVGLGWVWLGTYWFDAGTNGYVDISNEAPGYNPGNDVIIADAIRFGNGMGDVDRGFGLSGFERELECSRYWIQRSVGQGMSSSIYDLAGYADDSDNVGAPRRMVESMNREADGGFWDRVYLGFHSNASGGSSRGPLGLYDTRFAASVQSRQISYANTLVDYIAQNMEYGDNGVLFNDDWANTSASTYGSTYGELYGAISDEMNNTIIEVAFHDNELDCRLLKDACARRMLAWSCYQATVQHLHTNNAGIPLAFAPVAPVMPAAVNNGDGTVTVSWGVPAGSGIGAGTATGYVVYVSADGRAFGNPVFANGGSTEECVLSNLTVDATWYFRVTALSEGGESMPSETVGVRVTDSGPAQHLVVNGFDRVDRSLSPVRYFANNLNGSVTMVRPEHINSYDYVIQYGEAISQTNAWFDSCAHGALSNVPVALSNYAAAYWILGEESTTDETFNAGEQALVTPFLADGGSLFVSGAELLWDLDYLGSAADRLFCTNVLRAAYAADSAGTNRVSALGGSIFAGMSGFAFQDTMVGETYPVDYPDCLATAGGSVAALQYDSGHTAATVYSNGCKVVVMGFPFETIEEASDRTALMQHVLGFFESGEPQLTITDGSRTIPQSYTEWTINGTCASVAGQITWSNGAYAGGQFAVQSPWSFTATNLQEGANVIAVTASNAAGVLVRREVTITRSTHAFGNCWHIPSNSEPGENTMRNPLAPLAFQTVYFFSGNQFTGEGNAANQTGGTLYYRKVGDATWNSTAMSFDSEAGQNKYWLASVPGNTYEVGDELEYYFEITYSDRDTSYIGTWDAGADSAVFVVQSEAAAHPFSFTYGGYPGNCWHIPDVEEPSTVTMRNPVEPCAFQAVYIYSGNQFQGEGNAADQSDGVLYYRRSGEVAWVSAGMAFDVTEGNNKYWSGTIPSNTFVTGDAVEYYIEVQYNERDTTYISRSTNGADYAAGAYRSLAQANPFVYTNQGFPGNGWHIPDSEEPTGHRMRDPQQQPDAAYPVTIRSGNQFTGEGNPGNQTGLVLHYRVGLLGDWSTVTGSFEAEEGQNKYWKAVLPAGSIEEGSYVQYYLEMTYSDHDTTYVSTDGAGSSSVFIEESAARLAPFAFSYASSAETIRFQGFEGSASDTWPLVSGAGYISSDTGSSDTDPANQRIRSGSYSWQRQDDITTTVIGLELDEISLVGHTNVKVYVHVSATDPNYASSGMDDNDYLKIHVATNGADYNENADITLFGRDTGVRWGYDALGVASTIAGIYRSYQPLDNAPIVRTNDGYATAVVSIPDTVDRIRMKINTAKQFVNEYWNIDDIQVAGTPDLSDPDADGAPSYAEYIAGTDPHDAASVFRLVGHAQVTAGQGRVVSWDSTAGRLYDLSCATGLAGAFSPVATNLPATPPQNVYTDTTHSAEQRIYYRIGVREP